MKNPYRYLFAIVVVILWATSSVSRAQFGGEDERESIAGILAPGGAAEWTFKSSGDEILFASLDAEIYRAAMDGHDTAESGCSGEEGGPGLFYIVVLGPNDEELCRAERPVPPPGWMRDPRIACKIPWTKRQSTYILRVGLNIPTGETTQDYYSFSLNVSLRGIAPVGGDIRSAIEHSTNRFDD